MNGDTGHRVLVLANETCSGGLLVRQLAIAHTESDDSVLVVAPALTSRMRFWVSDVDASINEARRRLHTCVAELRDLGIDAGGWIGDSDPFLALQDAVRSFDPHEVVISTHPPDRSNWLERDLVGRARRMYTLPITHVIVDLRAGSVRVQRPLSSQQG